MSLVRSLSRICFPSVRPVFLTVPHQRFIHVTAVSRTFTRQGEDDDPWPKPKEWPLRNHLVYPPQSPDELRRRAECFHFRANVKYSPKKMWYICMFVRGMAIDEAMKQLTFVPKKGAVILKEILEEARELAITEHNFEHRSNMFIGACHTEKGLTLKGARKHAFYRMGEIKYYHTHVLVRLVEGPPPEDYHLYNFSNTQKLEQYVEDLRRRNIKFSL